MGFCEICVMESKLLDISSWRAVLLVLVPLLYLGAAVMATAWRSAPEAGWRIARWSAALALATALLSMVALLAAGTALVRGPVMLSLGGAGPVHFGLRSDVLGTTVQLLVSFIGWVIVGYSQNYLGGASGQTRYIRCLLLTLSAVTLLVVTNNLVILVLAWISTSLALHGLLTFFAARPQALIAAHKKFLASRVADLCLLGGVALIGQQLGTLDIDRAMAAARALPVTPIALQCAAVLLATSALLKCAQLPVHGWLIQVMEAPTPVSALLHAGVVNLGGFLLIRLGTLVADVPAAQVLLVVVGSVTAVVAALVMTTRVSVKVALAWSTCAQMGFMLMQCGLGLHALALLHLVAHSLYKAHAFLSAGGAVEQDRVRQLTAPAHVPGLGLWWLGAIGGLAAVVIAAWVWGLDPALEPGLWVMGLVLALAIAPLFGSSMPIGGFSSLAGPVATLAVVSAYVGLHAIFGRLLASPASVAQPATALVFWAAGCFALLYAVQGVVRARPLGTFARRLYPALFAGLYLDELFTRLTFRLWPVRVPVAAGVLASASSPARSHVKA